MKVVSALGLLLALQVCTGVRLGPKECVSLSRSTEGSCVFRTNCENEDLSKFEFLLSCKTGSTTRRHSFGIGGFDNVEAFDTKVKCDTCEVPQPDVPVVMVHSSSSSHRHTEKATEEPPKDESKISKYGPDNCVSTWRSEKSSHCFVSTACKEKKIDNYEFGLICKDKKGLYERHLFGKDSFNPEETFDTLIPCDRCEGLGGDTEKVTGLAEAVASLKDEVKGVKSDLDDLKGNVKALNKKAFGGKKADDDTNTEAKAEDENSEGESEKKADDDTNTEAKAEDENSEGESEKKTDDTVKFFRTDNEVDEAEDNAPTAMGHRLRKVVHRHHHQHHRHHHHEESE